MAGWSEPPVPRSPASIFVHSLVAKILKQERHGKVRQTAGKQGGLAATAISVRGNGDLRPLALRFPGPRTVSSAGS